MAPNQSMSQAFSKPTLPIRSVTYRKQKAPSDSSTRVKEVLSDRLTSVPVVIDTYEYGRIHHHEEIRILRIWPGKRTDKIQCELYTIPLRLPASVEYTALSYWWGKPEEIPSHTIELFHELGPDGKPKWGMFRIRDNLNAALQKLRHETQMRDVWVDAVCINQNYNPEKKAQVSRMHEVYTQAENVVIWLGKDEPVPTASETFDFLKDILDLRGLDILVEEPTKENAANWAKVVSLMSKEWFSRRWVIQELALSRNATIRYGDEDIEWSNFADAIALFMTNYKEIKRTNLDRHGYHEGVDARAFGANTIVRATTNLFRKSPEGYVEEKLLPLEVLVTWMLVAFEAREPKDTIFAVLTLANDTHFTGASKQDPRIAPEYEKELLDVYIDFIDYCIDTSKSLDVLCRHWASMPTNSIEAICRADSGLKSRGPSDMPTWIPWINGYAFGKPSQIQEGRLHGDSIVGKLERKGQRTYNASLGLKPSWKFGKVKSEELENFPAPLEREPTISENFRRQFTKRKPTFLQSTSQKVPPSKFTNGSAKRPAQLRNLSSDLSHKKHDGTLMVKGFALGTVDQKSARISGEGVIPDTALMMGGWILGLQSPAKEQQDVPDKLWRTMVANRGPNGASPPSWYRRACLECLQQVSRTGDLSIDSLKRRQNPKTASTMILFLDRVQETVFNRRFFTTKAHSGTHATPIFGLGSKWVNEGDVICILFGCSVPVVLREIKEEGNHHFQFIGECFAYGVMDGEALSENLPHWPDCLEWPYNLPKLREENFIKKFLLK